MAAISKAVLAFTPFAIVCISIDANALTGQSGLNGDVVLSDELRDLEIYTPASVWNGRPERSSRFKTALEHGSAQNDSTRTRLRFAGSTEGAFKFTTLVEPNTLPPIAPSISQSPVDIARDHLQKREFDRALADATRLIAENPKDPQGYIVQGGGYMGKGDYANARQSLEKALKLAPDYIPAIGSLAQLDLLQKDVAAARKRFESILAREPKNINAMVGMAQVEANSKHEKEGLAWLSKAKTTDPQAIPPRVYLGAYYLRSRQFPQALAELSDAHRYQPNNTQLLDLLAQAQLANGQKAEAVATYRQLVSASPESPLAYLRLANAQINNEEVVGADESLRKALQLKPDYADAVYTLAALYVRTKRYDEALKLARDLQRLTPKSTAGLLIEGDILFAQQRYTDSAAAYERGLALNPTGALVLKLHAAQTKVGDPKEAEARLNQWVKDHPDDMAAAHYLAAVNSNAGRNAAAIAQYEGILKKHSDDLLALNNLAYLYQEQKDSRALPTAERAIKLSPESSTTTDTMGWILVQQGKPKQGLELLQKAASKAPNNAEIRYHLAFALAKSGDKTNAKKELEQLLKGNTEFRERKAAQELLKQL